MVMLAQAAGDREILARQLGISPHQLSYVTHSGSGEGYTYQDERNFEIAKQLADNSPYPL